MPLFAFTIGTFLLVFLTIWYIADEQDRIEIQESRDLLLTILEQENEESLLRVQDYAIWDTAYEKLVLDLDADWAADNIGQYIHVTFPEKRSYVIGPDNEIVYAAEEGVRLLPERASRYSNLGDIITHLRSQFKNGDGRARLSTYVTDFDGGIWIAAISVIKPDFADLTEADFTQTSDELSFLVFMRQINGLNLENIGRDFGFPELSFYADELNAYKKPASIFMYDFMGKPLGTVTWTPALLGQQQINQTLKNSAVLLLILIGLMAFVWAKGFNLLKIVNTTFNKLNESRRIAKMYEKGITELVDGEFLYELSVYEALQKITVNAARTLGIDRVTIWRYDNKTDIMHNMFVHDAVNPEAEQKMLEFKLSEHADLDKVVSGGEPVEFYSEAKNTNLVEFDKNWWSEKVPPTMLSVPIVRHKLKGGIIFFSSYNRDYDWTPEKLRFAAAITDIVSLIMEGHARNIIETELRAAKNRAEAANAAKTDFLANMSHELRTPLNAIIGFSDIMNQKIFGDLGAEQYTEYTKDINVSARHLLSLINDILEVSKHESGKFELHPEEISLEEELNHAVRVARGRFMEKKAIVTIDVSPEVEVIEADIKCFRQIAMNLISNAIKFSKDACILEITASQENDYVCLTIKDNGIGIPKEMQKKVFEAFAQVENAFTRIYEGTGLGLAITKGLVELHGGNISLESMPDEGTTIIVRLPISQEEICQKRQAAGL